MKTYYCPECAAYVLPEHAIIISELKHKTIDRELHQINCPCCDSAITVKQLDHGELVYEAPSSKAGAA